ncbi:hypothetical protein [Paraferrimonas sp. SM1919]|uniref:hypothetical protein n=1 Tax=Paraferrimonas sp. SM1919 TaxID=2662263 RepID=UPI0013D49D94|nr:hypothetical protein [Paraferrimonas sp. SM1919]
MSEKIDVFDSVRRGYNDLESSSNDDIADFFGNADSEAMTGHISNVKGMVFEQQVTSALNEQGLEASIHEATNHPDTDLSIYLDGEVAAELQLKATDDVSYIRETLADNPDIPIIATSEVAAQVDDPMVIDSGIENAELTSSVSDALAGEASSVSSDAVSEGLAEVVTETALPISPIGAVAALLGLPFL